MKNPYAYGLAACLALSGGLTGCYTQLYTQGYASRALDAPASENPASEIEGYARSPQNESDTLTGSSEDSALAAGERDSAAWSTVVVNNYYRESPYYRGYLVDEWEYPMLSFGFYSSRYRDYYGAYWWNDPGYYRSYHRPYHRGYHRPPSYPSSGGGNPGPYSSDKRLFSNPPQRVIKGHRASGNDAPATPAPKQSAETSAPKAEAAPAKPPSDNGGSSGSNSGDSEDQQPKPSKGRRR
ncbi:MAG: hypothetical protein ABI036_04385 [Fibrobacteria bacterium]